MNKRIRKKVAKRRLLEDEAWSARLRVEMPGLFKLLDSMDTGFPLKVESLEATMQVVTYGRIPAASRDA